MNFKSIFKQKKLAGGLTAFALAAALISIPVTADARDTPAGFYYGADTNAPGPVGSGVEYTFPNCGGAYGSYVGRVDSPVDSDNHEAFSNAANRNGNAGDGIGSQNYYLLTGPDDAGATTATAAYNYGVEQGNMAMSNAEDFYNTSGVVAPSWSPLIYGDVESFAGDGWDSNAGLNRDVFNGFFDTINGSALGIDGLGFIAYPGIYGGPSFVNGTLSGTLPHTLEWTPVASWASYTSTAQCASGWNSNGHTASFFLGDGSGSACAVSWQYISGATVDYNQVDVDRIMTNEESSTCF